ncbi:MAG: prephenate dehydrogenase/arogenate dehydrogenase family protein [Candidatus Koribacter versatilis]|uniref:Prephenate dehydrogenase/arogenate dehydrogenase family protein n=1 Tax=Candidatus Korobacter versatilis TaxID=658062 RepID=A0A932A920_9BACT|nr:prephenate dehydrogenase/arogenate dehydrogenase family protein [Candidatus Koribacter versatilis]
MFKQITIVGTGLIGGSLGLALKCARFKAAGFKGTIIGCDRAEVLKAARQRGAIDRGETDCSAALRGSDLVILATPVGAIIDFLDRLGPALGKRVFVTDVGSTKQEIVARARHVFGPEAATRFLGGHPMAGKEHGGIAHAGAALFQDALWFLTPAHDQDLDDGAAADWAELVAAIGARVTTITPEAHDQLVAWTSHLPQLLSTALASSLADFAEQLAADAGDDIEVREAGGRGLRDMTRLAGSPYDMWRDIALTNTANIADALLQLEQKLAHIRENLRTRELEAEFRRGQDQGQSQSFNAEAPSAPRKSKRKNKKTRKQKKQKTSASSAPRR